MLCITQGLPSAEPSIRPENNEMGWCEQLIDAITRLCLWLISLLPGRGTHNDPAVPANLPTRNIEHIPAPAVSVPAPEAMRPSPEPEPAIETMLPDPEPRPSTPMLAPAAAPTSSDASPEKPGLTPAQRKMRKAAKQLREQREQERMAPPSSPLPDTPIDREALKQCRQSRPVSAQAGPETAQNLEEEALDIPSAVQKDAPEQQAMEGAPVPSMVPAPATESAAHAPTLKEKAQQKLDQTKEDWARATASAREKMSSAATDLRASASQTADTLRTQWTNLTSKFKKRPPQVPQED